MYFLACSHGLDRAKHGLNLPCSTARFATARSPSTMTAAAHMINRVPSAPLTSQDHQSAAAVLVIMISAMMMACDEVFS
jgi:hypothetical protein